MATAQTVTIAAQCPKCQGTGLYSTHTETDGAALVCADCKGAGEQTVRYIPFTGKKPPPDDVRKVFAQNTFTHITGATGGGVTLSQWQADPASPMGPGAEIRDHACPASWFSHLPPSLSPARDDRTGPPDWDDCIPTRLFTWCPSFPRSRNAGRDGTKRSNRSDHRP